MKIICDYLRAFNLRKSAGTSHVTYQKIVY